MSKSGKYPYDEFAEDETYPCPRCKSVKDPRRCLKSCSRYRLWRAVDWINMQYNAELITAAERDEQILAATKKFR